MAGVGDCYPMSQRKVFVFGSNVAALISALDHQSRGAQVTLFDPGQHFQEDEPHFFGTEISFWPSSDLNFENLGWLEQLVNLDIGGIEKDLPPLTFESKEPTAFIGFGEKTYSSLPAAANLNQRARLSLNCSEKKIFLRLRELFTGTIKEFSEISKINLSSDGIESVEINGAKEHKADHYVFAQTPSEILELLPQEALGSRIRSQLARIAVFTRVSLSFPLDENQGASASENMIFLLPNPKDQQPVMGLIQSDHCIWQSYLPVESTEDPENLAVLIRNMKKIIGRSLPDMKDSLSTASIEVEKEAFAEYPWEKAWDDFKKHNNNATLVSPLWSNQQGLAAAVQSCARHSQSPIEGPCREVPDLLENQPI